MTNHNLFSDHPELRPLAELRADVPGPSDAVLNSALTALEERVRDAGAQRSTHHVPHVSLRWRVAAAAAAAAVIAGGAYALTDDGTPGTTDHRAVVITPGASPSGGVHVVNAAALLDVAARHAVAMSGIPAGHYRRVDLHERLLSTYDNPPDDGAYVFSESRVTTWLPANPDGTSYEHGRVGLRAHAATAAQQRRAERFPGHPLRSTSYWYSTDADGTLHRLAPAGPDAQPTCSSGANCDAPPSLWDEASRAAVDAAPRDVATLRRSLFSYARKQHRITERDGAHVAVAEAAFAAIANVLDTGNADSTLQASLLRVAKTVPGIRLVGRVTNYDGVRGLGIALTPSDPITQTLIFSRDGAYLGDKQVLARPDADYRLATGTVIGWTAVTTSISGRPSLP